MTTTIQTQIEQEVQKQLQAKYEALLTNAARTIEGLKRENLQLRHELGKMREASLSGEGRISDGQAVRISDGQAVRLTKEDMATLLPAKIMQTSLREIVQFTAEQNGMSLDAYMAKAAERARALEKP
jgi:hypothetical protein